MTATRKRTTRKEPSEEIQRAFSTPQWAADLFKDPSLIPVSNESRETKPLTNADSFCAVTLKTPETISECQNFHRVASTSSGPKEVLQVLKLGSGVNGHPDTCHGGFVSVLMDEILGSACEYVRPSEKTTMTAYLKVDYKQPVMTPSTILCRGWVEKIEGRKLWARGTVEDGEGGILTTGEALFVVVERRKPREKI